MLKKHFAAYVAATALMTAAAVAQTSPAGPSGNQPAMNQPTMNQPTMSQPGAAQPGMNQPTMSEPLRPVTGAPAMGAQMQGAAGAPMLLTEMSPGQLRGSDLIGLDVYGADNERIGEINELVVTPSGSIEAAVVGVGGFLGIGEKRVAIPFDQIQFVTENEARAMASNQNAPATTGNVTTPASPATTGSTGQAAATADDNDEPERAVVRMTRADLQNAPEFRFSKESNRRDSTGAAGNTNPPASAPRPGVQPQ